MKSLCVYCGSARGADARYADAARQLAASMVGEGIELVYGGGNVGLMGVIADEVLRLGGRATGVIPRNLMEREVGHAGLTELIVVGSMHERKAAMAERSEGFVALPGGLGTLEELFEMLTWSQLGLHRKPVAVLDVAGFYQGLVDFIAHQVQAGFVKADQARLLICEIEPAALLTRMRDWQAPVSTKVQEALAAHRALAGGAPPSPA